MQMSAMFSGDDGHSVILVSHSGPDASIMSQLQHWVDSTHAQVSVVTISKELIGQSDTRLAASAVATAFQDLPTPQLVSFLSAPDTRPAAAQLSDCIPDLTTHRATTAAADAGSASLTAVAAKVRAAAIEAMGDDSGDQFGDNEPLLAAGLTSASAVSFVHELEQTFSLSLPETLAFDYPTITELAAHIHNLTADAAATHAVQSTDSDSQLPAAMAAALSAATSAAAAVAAGVATTGATAAQASTGLTPEGHRQKMLELVIAAASEAIGTEEDCEQPALQQPLMDAGLSSAGAVQLVAALEASTGLDLPGTLAFNYPSIAELTDYLLSFMPETSRTACPVSNGVQPLSLAVQHKSAVPDSSLADQTAAQSVGTTAGAHAQTDMTSAVLAALQDTLNLSPADAELFDIDSPLMDVGLNSTLSIQLTTQLESTLQLDLPGALVFDYPTVRELAAHLSSLAGNSPALQDQSTVQAPEMTNVIDNSSNSRLQAVVSELVSSFTQEDLDDTTPLMEGGLTSATVIQLTSALEDAVAVELPGTLLFDYPTIASLVQYLASCNATLPSANSAETPTPDVDSSAPSMMPASHISTDSTPAYQAASTAVASAQVPRALSVAEVNGGSPAIAVVSSAQRVPGGVLQPEAHAMPVDRISTVPLDRWDSNEAPSDSTSELNAAFGAFVAGADQFDAAAFHLSGAEATLMDPQQRLLLETFAEAQQGITQWGSQPTEASRRSSSSDPKQRFGVYVGVSQLEYARITLETGTNLNAYYATGAHLSVTSGRIAYTFGLKGPAMAGTNLSDLHFDMTLFVMPLN